MKLPAPPALAGVKYALFVTAVSACRGCGTD